MNFYDNTNILNKILPTIDDIIKYAKVSKKLSIVIC